MRKLLILFFTILMGCNLAGGGTGQGADLTGSEGLVITKGTIPNIIYPGQSFSIPITLENKGTSNIEDAILSISGYEEQYVHFDVPPIVEKINLEGRTALTPIGERTTKIFRVGSISLPQGKDIAQVFLARVCYKYKTIASPIVCINPKLASGESVQPGACDPSKVQLSSTQGAPLAVTKVEVIPLSNEGFVSFIIHVKDVSKGPAAILEDSYAKPCARGIGTLFVDEVGKIKIEAFLSGQKIQCFSLFEDAIEADMFKITKEGPFAICRATIDPEADAYTTPLSIELSYGHGSSEVFSVDLKSTTNR